MNLQRALFILCGFFIAASACAQELSREQRLAQVLSKTNWPNGRALLTIFRASLPQSFLIVLGRSYKLGSQWGSGNPHWELARAAIDDALRADELRNGPLIPNNAAAFARSIGVLPFTDEDIAFLDQVVETPFGRVFVELLDLAAVGVIAQKLAGAPDTPPETRLQLLALHAQVRDAVGPAAQRVEDAKQKQTADAERLEAMIDRVDMAKQTSVAAGRELMQRPKERMAQVLLVDTMLTVQAQVKAFRASEEAAAAQKGATQ